MPALNPMDYLRRNPAAKERALYAALPSGATFELDKAFMEKIRKYGAYLSDEQYEQAMDMSEGTASSSAADQRVTERGWIVE